MKIRRPGDSPPNSRIGRAIPIERWKTPYIRLECGHLTDWDTQQVYSMLRPVRGKFFCEQDDKWFKAMKIVKPVRESSQEPLF